MHRRHCLQLADRMHAVLQRELGAGLDRHRMLMDERYVRDVLLVCEGLADSPGPLLAHHFRRAWALPDEPAPNPALATQITNVLLGRHMATPAAEPATTPEPLATMG
jgi:hypothetical protein